MPKTVSLTGIRASGGDGEREITQRIMLIVRLMDNTMKNQSKKTKTISRGRCNPRPRPTLTRVTRRQHLSKEKRVRVKRSIRLCLHMLPS